MFKKYKLIILLIVLGILILIILRKNISKLENINDDDTYLESEMKKNNYELYYFFKQFRLMNPYPFNTTHYKIYDQQIKYNIPLLIFMCKKLNEILINEHRNTVLFLSRDGCLIIKLFKYLYPNYNSIYFHSSRLMNINYNKDYVEYVKRVYNKDTCILFDLNGSFYSGRKLFMKEFGHLPRVFLFNINDINNYYDGMTYITSNHFKTGCNLESLNIDKIGTLINFINGKDIRKSYEFNIEDVNVIHETIDKFIKYLNDNKNILNTNFFENTSFWIDYNNNYICKREPIFEIKD